ncbi:divalent-cation tolerance protein CutA [Candidatus Bathyarchaeota archaeon]|nr:MAG: divalent-cation tolerance protein CutA [Candidatus Bathyarchaeota archaeon]
MGYIMVFITTPTQENAEKISSMLMEEKLAACVSVVGEVKSTFYWEGKIEKEKEYLLIIKTKDNLFNKVPEILALNIGQGNPDYLKWVEETVKKEEG